MTDTYVERLIIEKFLEVPFVVEELKIKKYYSENEEELSKVEAWKTLETFVSWVKTYNDLPESEHNEDDDLIIEDIKSTTIVNEDKFLNDNIIYENFPSIAFPNIKFERPKDDDGNDRAWCELYFLSQAPLQIELGSTARSRWVGILHINVCIPASWGTNEANAMYDEIASTFRSGLIIEGVRIVRTYKTSALSDDDFYCLPVTVEWTADLER